MCRGSRFPFVLQRGGGSGHRRSRRYSGTLQESEPRYLRMMVCHIHRGVQISPGLPRIQGFDHQPQPRKFNEGRKPDFVAEKVGNDECTGQVEYYGEQTAKMEIDQGVCVNHIRGARTQNRNLLPVNRMWLYSGSIIRQPLMLI